MATYGYCRVSTAAQVEGGESLAVQQRKIEGQATALGMLLDHVYVEEGVSGSTPMEKRPQGKALLKAVTSGDTILVSKMDRMFRSASDALHVIEQFQKRKIHLHLLDISSGDCTGDGVAKLFVTVMSAIAEFERFRIRERIAESKAKLRQKGRHLGGSRTFGFTIVRKQRKGKGKPVPVLRPQPREQRAIRLMTLLAAKDHSLRAIAQRVQQKYGITISHMGVKAVLHREEAKRLAKEAKATPD